MESGGAEEFSEFSDYSLIYVLPHEIIISIFRKLPISELSFTIPSVCKQWYLVSTDSLLWRELYAEQWQTIPQGLRQQLSLSPRKGGKRFARFTLMPPRREKSNASCLALSDQAAPVTHDALKIALDSIVPSEFPLDDSGDDSGDESCDSSSEEDFEEEVLDAASASPRMSKRRATNDGYSTDDEAKDLFSSGESDTETRCSTPPSVSEVTPLPSDDEFEETVPKETELNWKSLFLERLAGEANWKDGNYTVSTLKGHSLAIMSVKFVDDTVYSCSLDGTIKTWNMSSKRCTATFNGHTDWVNSFDFDANTSRVDRLVSCSFDTTIKLWDTKKVECLSTLWGHQNIVWSVKMAGNKLVSCSSDSTMRIWDIEAGTCINTLTGHEGAIYCMYYDKERNIAVSGCQDKTVRFWDLNALGESNGGCVGVLRGHADRLCCLQWDGDQSLLVTGSHDSCIKLWDARMLEADDGSISINVKSEEDEGNNSAACLKTLTGHKGRVCCLQFDHEKIVSGSDDNKIKVWSLNGKEECINTLADHDYWVNTLYFKDNMLVSGAADDTIKIWDFSGKRRRGGKGGVNAFEANGVLGKAARKVKEHKWKDGLSNLASTAGSTFDWGTPSFSLAQTLSVADRCMIA